MQQERSIQKYKYLMNSHYRLSKVIRLQLKMHAGDEGLFIYFLSEQDQNLHNNIKNA